MAEPHVSLAAEELWRVGPISVTNSILLGLLGSLVTLAILLYVVHKLKKGQRNFLTAITQWTYEGFWGQARDIVGNTEVARKIFPIAITMFFFVIVNYWTSILPGVATITYNGAPLFRALPADLNFTFGLAIVTLIAAQIYAVKSHGFIGNIGRYARNPFKDPIGAIEGLLEFIGEFSRHIALSFRLFGNAFAGEILLILIAILTSYFASVTLPLFMVFELFIGFIQAYVFFVLTLIFTSLAIASHGDDSSSHSTAAVKPKKATQSS